MLLPPTRPPASTAPGEGLHGDLIEGSCGRRRHRGMPNRQNVGEPDYLFQSMKLSLPKAVRQITAATVAARAVSPISFFINVFFCFGRTTTCNFPLYSHDVGVLLMLCVSFVLVI